MGGRVTVKVQNKGTNPAGEFTVELVLSSDTQIPLQPGTYSDTFVEDMLLRGGRRKVESLDPGETKTLKLEGPLKIPADTPPGRFYLGSWWIRKIKWWKRRKIIMYLQSSL